MNDYFSLLMSILPYAAAGLVLFYLLLSLFLTYLVQELPRKPVKDPPSWGRVLDTFIPAVDGGSLEIWRIEPDGPSRGIVVFAHGWGRNRDRMVNRARQFAGWGFTAVIHSARDHGNSSPRKFMNAVKFAEDIEAVLKWVNAPVLLYGHSAGSAGAIIAAHRNPGMVRLLFLEASYSHTKKALMSLYRWVNPAFGRLFGPMIVFWMDLFYGGRLEEYSPARMAPGIRCPVMIVHGMKDCRFPVSFAMELKQSFSHDRVACYFSETSGHSDTSLTKGYSEAVKAFMDQHLDETYEKTGTQHFQ